jgi:spore coat protein A
MSPAAKGFTYSEVRLGFLILAFLLMGMVTVLPVTAAPPTVPPGTINPTTIPKYVNQLLVPPAWTPASTAGGVDYYEINISEFQQQVLPTGMPTTTVWGYGGLVGTSFVRNAPAGTFEVTRNTPVKVKWTNDLTGKHLYAVDPTLHWADPNSICGMPVGGICPASKDPVNITCIYHVYENMCMPVLNCAGAACPAFPPGFSLAQYPVAISTHVHGGEQPSAFDGGPEQWWTWNGLNGTDYRTFEATTPGSAVYYYPNEQNATTLWYHDHALGITRINVLSGLAGFYLLRDPADPTEQVLANWTGTPYEVPLAIQDRTFWAVTDPTGNNAYKPGDFWFPTVGLNPTIHPYWMPEFFGNTIMVNGRVWPNMNVEPGTYRFRLLDGSNARFYTLSFSNKMGFTQIGTDGGYLKSAVPLTQLTIAPGERADILVDFSALPVGTKVILMNTAKAPFPKGTPADPQTTGQIIQFTVVPATATTPAFPVLPATLNPTLAGATFPTIPAAGALRKVHTLQEVMGPGGPVEILLDGQKWGAPTSELPAKGSVEEWVIVNPTADTHPIHLHLVQFQLVSRQAFQVSKYQKDWLALQGNVMLPLMQPTVQLDPIPYLQGKVVGPTPNEMGWKDTIQMNPGEVTTIRVRFARQDGTGTAPNYFSFNPSDGPGYVWHCHIIDHEDNEMMRRYFVV